MLVAILEIVLCLTMTGSSMLVNYDSNWVFSPVLPSKILKYFLNTNEGRFTPNPLILQIKNSRNRQ